MKHATLFFAVCLSTIILCACEEEIDTTTCTNIATVDRESVSGCEITLSLEQGGSIVPTWLREPIFCPVGMDFSQIDSLQNLMQHGDTVRIGYDILEEREPCQGVPIAYITCLEVLSHAATDNKPIR